MGSNTGVGGNPPDSGGLATLLVLEPGDLTTGHDGASVRIAVKVSGSYLSPPPSVSATLRRHPSDEIVATTLVMDEGDAEPLMPSWVLQPDALLDEGWYALVVADDGKSAAYNAHQRPDGSFEARFRVGSEPLLIGVAACASQDLTLLPKVRLDFSELVELTAAAPVQVFADGAPVSCQVYEPPSSSGMGLTCTPPLPAGAAISVEVGVGFTSVSSGLGLKTSTSPLPRTFELPPILQYQACREWRENVTPQE
jgi:hypothetical protein